MCLQCNHLNLFCVQKWLIWCYAALLWFDSLMKVSCGPKHVAMFSVILYHKYVGNMFMHFVGLASWISVDKVWNEQHKVYTINKVLVCNIQKTDEVNKGCSRNNAGWSGRGGWDGMRWDDMRWYVWERFVVTWERKTCQEICYRKTEGEKRKERQTDRSTRVTSFQLVAMFDVWWIMHKESSVISEQVWNIKTTE
jgi:hypothetical protein